MIPPKIKKETLVKNKLIFSEEVIEDQFFEEESFVQINQNTNLFELCY